MKLLILLLIVLLLAMLRYYIDIKRLIKKMNQMNDSQLKQVFNQKK
jgi:hypothetical protein